MSEPMATSDALGGVDGTQLPEPLPVLVDPLTGLERGTGREVPELPLFTLPPAPDLSAMREAITAALSDHPTDDPTGPVDQHPAVVPTPQPAPQATDQPNVPSASDPGASVPSASVPTASVGVPPPAAASVGGPAGRPTGGPPPTSVGDHSSVHRPLLSRPPMAAVSRKLVPQVDFRRRIRQERAGSLLGIRSNGGATALLLLMLIIIFLLVYNIVTGFLEWVSGLLP
ncbi:MAG TPA: hypothetical protein VK887_03615 [Pseudonocardiaceae bacterium]|nr:hypothetical protein [Pseudonocardiaceae bacterium]